MTIVGTILNGVGAVLLVSGCLALTRPAVIRIVLAGLVFIVAAIAMQIGGWSGTWTVWLVFLGVVITFVLAGVRHGRLVAEGQWL